MSIINENINIKIKDVYAMTWDTATVSVAVRPYHTLVFRLHGRAVYSHEHLILSSNVGDVFYVPSNYAYKAMYAEKNEGIVIRFESESLSEMANYSSQNADILQMLFQQTLDIWNKKDKGYFYSALMVMCKILETLSAQQIPQLHNKTMEAFNESINYMETNYTCCALSVEKLVAIADMSNTYFRKLFCQRFNMTPSKYLTSIRLIHAEKLLASGEYSIKKAAELSGFADVKYFSRVVKKEYGVSPSQLYRHIITHKAL